jgi:hypothetical protein
MANIDKFCVFCGKTPEAKTKEHIIPQWLIEYTGDPDRKAFFGVNMLKSDPELRLYSFSSFVFPACDDCNREFSSLEVKASKIVDALLKKEPLTMFDFDVLLDWLDKVRVGLWLGFFYLDKNLARIRPQFYIKSRVKKRDRFVIIYLVDTDRTGINFAGVESPSFQHMPSCFGLLINDVYLFNASNLNLCDRRLGFSYSREQYHTGYGGSIESDFVEGLHRKLRPVMRSAFLPNGSELYQPIFAENIENEAARELYDCEYVRHNSMNWAEGIGKIFQQFHDRIEEYPSDPSLNWLPEYSHPFKDLIVRKGEETLDYQLYLFENTASTAKLSKDGLKEYKLTITFMRKVNELIKHFIRTQADRMLS